MSLSDLASPNVVPLPSTASASSASRLRIPRVGVTIAVAWLAVLAVGALAAAAGLTADPLANDYAVISQAPSLAHPFGTDNLGRDVFSRSLHGAGASAIVALVTVTVGGGLGILLGVWAGLRRGIADAITGFVTDVTIALPSLIIVATIVTLAGPSLPTIALTIAAFAIPVFARLGRSATLAVATENHVVVARTLGASGWRILTREVLPGVLPALMPFVLTTLATAIVAEGALSFLGFGLRPPEPSWGGLIAEGRTQLALAPWVTLMPALLLCATILSINVLGEHLREAKR
ncbi:ABC transporter permease [Agreia sp. VKM Ac-1783]|uniref:ABC transporter permease n=1 Tax=Agreia sp. VKM Ac-1783 TaxID=1938889 RepID=UPI000A2ADAD8|nr:ABC transporter permease [Agreia sp. VKM Ac-1783]SMQ73659.1 peptide/nickel transport system permease protein [Agreia sp. VKM Ac-1783]